MFDSTFSNIKHPEPFIRMVIATLILAYSVITGNVSFTVLSLLIYHTAYKKYCFVYTLLNINKKYRLENYYLSFIPKHSPSEVIIFSEIGDVLFVNEAGKENLSNILSISDIDLSAKKHQSLIDNNQTKTIIYNRVNHKYKIELQGISTEKLLLAYFTDVTELIELNNEITKVQSEVIYTMGGIGEFRSKETGNHVKRVALYSEKLALLYGMSQEEASLLKLASPMHDIGKIAIPDSILNAPRKLTADEFKIMKTHTKFGYDMLKNSNQKIFQAAATVAHEHHEKFDGTGYPRNLEGEDIHIFGRITAIADVFDALLSKRVYKHAWDMKDILILLHKESGKQFDPHLIKIFIVNLNLFLEIHKKYTD